MFEVIAIIIMLFMTFVALSPILILFGVLFENMFRELDSIVCKTILSAIFILVIIIVCSLPVIYFMQNK
ncbi:hypothetical protein EDD63_11636 [Breznakia blatticola]|uniref:Uncharacterized protein n=1 Tax=Breznakia blatticola TaxID=1754012 RepID=A0A4V3G7Q6_9FIRM|nr:hypothetical protein EDD63_11636 [Breznakia blatticola]